MSIFIYIVTSDSGFAPNPFHGWCTLACCKPTIRRTADEGDWIIGITSARQRGPRRVVYAMKIEDVLPVAEYWDESALREKEAEP